MIETTYIRLEQAAAMLDTEADTLLIAAAEGRMRLYGLLNQFRCAEKHTWKDGASMTVDTKWDEFCFVPLEPSNCAEVLCSGDTGGLYFVSDPDENGLKWNIHDSTVETRLEAHRLFAKRADVEAIKAAHVTPKSGTIKNELRPNRAHVSDWLALLNQASWKWWANADRFDSTTHPAKSDVVAWLIDCGMNESLAKHASTIIRPEWGHVGRKPDA